MRIFLASSLALALACIVGCGETTSATDAAASTDAPPAPMDAPAATDAPIAMEDAPSAADAPTGADAPQSDSGPPGPCTDDAREEDDSIAAAIAAPAVYSLTGETELEDLVACPGDDDFVHGYADCCDDALGAEIRWTAADGALELSVLAPDGTPWPTDDDVTEAGRARSVETSTAEGHDFVVRIHNPGTTPIAYDATIYARVFGP